MMLSNPGRGRLQPKRSRRRARIAKIEVLEGRDLPSTVSFHSPAGIAPVQVASPVQPSTTPGPQVASVQFATSTGRVIVQFTGEASGYDATSLTNPANYSFSVVRASAKLPTMSTSKARGGVAPSPTSRVTGVTLSPTSAPGMPRSVVVSIDNNRPIRSGTYRFTIRSGGVEDLGGRPLEGSYDGTFPSGGSGIGGDFQALLVEKGGTVLPPLPTAGSTNLPTAQVFAPTAKAVRVRHTAAKPDQSHLAAGQGITQAPLDRQEMVTTPRLVKPTTSSGKKH